MKDETVITVVRGILASLMLLALFYAAYLSGPIGRRNAVFFFGVLAILVFLEWRKNRRRKPDSCINCQRDAQFCWPCADGWMVPSESALLSWATGWRSEDGEPEGLTTEERMVWCIVRAIRREMTQNRCLTPNPVRAEQPEGKGASGKWIRGLDANGMPLAPAPAAPGAAPSGVRVDEAWAYRARQIVRGIDAEAEPFASHKDDLLISAKELLTAALAGKDGA